MKISVAALFAFSVITLPAGAQERSLSLTPYAGVFADNSFDSRVSLNNTGPIFGATLGFKLARDPRLSVFADLGYATVSNIGRSGTDANHVIYGHAHLLANVGSGWQLTSGRVSTGLEVAAGLDWVREDVERQVGAPLPGSSPNEKYTAHILVTPGAWATFQVAPNAAFQLRLRDYLITESGSNNLALTAGFRLRY